MGYAGFGCRKASAISIRVTAYDPASSCRTCTSFPGVWTVSVGYERLLDHLRSTYNLVEYDPALPDRPANLVPFAYDWRLSNRYNARRLKQVVQPVLERWRTYAGQPDARLILVCHSMGGLVARWYLDREGGAAYTSMLITIGTPHRGAASAIDRLVNGVRAGLGPLALDLSALARSLPSLHELLPEYACIEGDNGLRSRRGEPARSQHGDGHRRDGVPRGTRRDHAHRVRRPPARRHPPADGDDRTTERGVGHDDPDDRSRRREG